jgi:hypothetical protein
VCFGVMAWGGAVIEGLDIVQNDLKDAVSIPVGAYSGTVCWGTVLQAGRSQVQFPMLSLGFPIDIILLAALWPWGLLSLW